MNVWTNRSWEKVYHDYTLRKGLRFRFDKYVNQDIRYECIRYGYWLRSNYTFPVRVTIYVKSKYRIKTADGDFVTGVFYEPYSRTQEPRIKIATGDYEELKRKHGENNALDAYFYSIAHELTHYYQWINNLELTEIGIERQAYRYSKLIAEKYINEGGIYED